MMVKMQNTGCECHPKANCIKRFICTLCIYYYVTTAHIHREECVRFIIPQRRSFREEPLQHFALTQSLNYQNITPLIVQ